LRVLFWNLTVLASTVYEEGNFFRAHGERESVTKPPETGAGVAEPNVFPQISFPTTSDRGGFLLTPHVHRGKIPESARSVQRISGRQGEFTCKRVSWRPLREFRMTMMPGSTVQCVNPRCEVKGNWIRAEANGSDHCPACGEALRHVPPPLMPRMRFRPRQAAPRPSLRPR